MHPITRTMLALLLASVAASCPVAAGEAGSAVAGDAWRFRVYLDDQEIGYHHFYLDESGGTRHLRTVANFEYRLLFVKLYGYEHENRETWSGDCLQSIESRTDANGRRYQVEGRFEGGIESGQFRVTGSAGEATLPGCVMSFAYWNPAFLEQPRLLNSQDGEYLDVQVSPPVAESLEVRGEPRAAYRYRLEAGELRLDLWYSTEREWLALESEVRGGRKLRYELM
ncbi:MAG TPA: DUF6134 family protein [Telluria sp.]